MGGFSCPTNTHTHTHIQIHTHIPLWVIWFIGFVLNGVYCTKGKGNGYCSEAGAGGKAGVEKRKWEADKQVVGAETGRVQHG